MCDSMDIGTVVDSSNTGVPTPSYMTGTRAAWILPEGLQDDR